MRGRIVRGRSTRRWPGFTGSRSARFPSTSRSSSRSTPRSRTRWPPSRAPARQPAGRDRARGVAIGHSAIGCSAIGHGTLGAAVAGCEREGRVIAVVTRARLDAELVRRGLARSRQQAAELIEQGRVTVHGVAAGKPATVVDRDTPVVVRDTGEREWASRGAHKLLGALDTFGDVAVAGRRCLDAGASTGGFTDVLLDRGAAEGVAGGVGYGPLVWGGGPGGGGRGGHRPHP